MLAEAGPLHCSASCGVLPVPVQRRSRASRHRCTHTVIVANLRALHAKRACMRHMHIAAHTLMLTIHVSSSVTTHGFLRMLYKRRWIGPRGDQHARRPGGARPQKLTLSMAVSYARVCVCRRRRVRVPQVSHCWTQLAPQCWQRASVYIAISYTLVEPTRARPDHACFCILPCSHAHCTVQRR